MKRYITTMFIYLIASCALGQNEDAKSEHSEMTETDSLYFIALNKYIVEIDSFYNKYSSVKQPKIIYLQYKDYLSNIPDSINGCKIQPIGLGNSKKYFRENDNNLRLVKIFPLTLKDGQFTITVIPYFAVLKRRKHLHLSLSDWTIIFFEFKDGHLIYQKTENGGI